MSKWESLVEEEIYNPLKQLYPMTLLKSKLEEHFHLRNPFHLKILGIVSYMTLSRGEMPEHPWVCSRSLEWLAGMTVAFLTSFRLVSARKENEETLFVRVVTL